MKRGIAVIGLAISAALAACMLLAQSSQQITPLNMKTGLWQTTMSYTGPMATGQPMKYQNCVKPEDLSGHTWAKDVVGKCSSVTVLKSTGTDADLEAKDCQVGGGMTAEGRGTFHLADSEHLTGTLSITFSGNNPMGGNGPTQMHAAYTSQWVGAACPAYMR